MVRSLPILIAGLLAVAVLAGASAPSTVRGASGTWDSGTWDSGTWDSGTWDSGTWDSGTWDSGTWDSGTWDSGTWDSGTWDSGTWDSGTWDSGTWDGSLWNGGPVPLWGFTAMHPPDGWSPAAAPTSALACLVDSGIDASHPALAPYVAHERSFLGGDGSDPAGHGTHMAGLVTAVGAPRLAVAKVLDETGVGQTSDVIAALHWCVSLDADVILLALTEDAPTKEFEKAVRHAARHAVVVASAGNAGPCDRCVSSPGEIATVVAVGAVGPDLRPAPFSSEGAKVDLYAPGVLIGSTYPGGAWRLGSGTSQAAAFVAGAAAYLAAQHPDWSSQRIAQTLRTTAADVGGESAGLLDLSAAASR